MMTYDLIQIYIGLIFSSLGLIFIYITNLLIIRHLMNSTTLSKTIGNALIVC